MSALLATQGVEASYGRRRNVLRGVDLELHAGEVVALLGPNGAGKTTLMKVVVGLLPVTAGTVSGTATGRSVGWVPQGGATYQRLTVRENLELFARLQGLADAPADIARRTARAAQLEPWFDTLARDLSGGLRQRLNVAVGMLGDPAVLVLDEPTTGVDLDHRAALASVLRERATSGCGVLCSTHSIEEAAAADRVVVLVAGRVAYAGSLDGLEHAAPDVALPAISAGALDDPVARGLLRLWKSAGEPLADAGATDAGGAAP